MGFYAAAQLVRDAEEHGVEARAPDINHSDWDCTLEPQLGAGTLHPRHAPMQADIRSRCALRLGLRQVDGFSEEEAKKIMAARAAPFTSVRDVWLRTGLQPASLRRLAEADAFRSLGLDRRAALWAVKALRRVADKDDLPLFARAALAPQETPTPLPVMGLGQQVVEDYRHLHLSLKAHPAGLLRPLFAPRIRPNSMLATARDGARITVAGLVLVRQRPGSAVSVFMTLEDETAIANVIVWPKIFEAYRPIVMGARLVAVRGRVQSESGVVHVIAEEVEDLGHLLRRLTAEGETVQAPEAVMPRGRNFH
jgi:error-prone DNA polymerase